MTARRHPAEPTDADALDAMRELSEARTLRQRRSPFAQPRSRADDLSCIAVDIATMRVAWIADRMAPSETPVIAPRPRPPCPWCNGYGVIAETGIVCRTCGGSGEQPDAEGVLAARTAWATDAAGAQP